MSATVPASGQTPESSEAAPGAEEESRELREAAVASLKRKRRFVQDAYGYVTVNGVLWLIWALTDRSSGGSMPWPAWVSAVWGFLLAMDAWRAFGPWPRSLHRPITEADIEREIRRSRPG
ncbi:MAG: 2TM domain-containing protein [Gaiellaceae bacterium]